MNEFQWLLHTININVITIEENHDKPQVLHGEENNRNIKESDPLNTSFSVKISQINHYFLFPNVKDAMSFEWGLIAVSDNECGHQYAIVCRYDSSYNSGAVSARPAPHCDV